MIVVQLPVPDAIRAARVSRAMRAASHSLTDMRLSSFGVVVSVQADQGRWRVRAAGHGPILRCLQSPYAARISRMHCILLILAGGSPLAWDTTALGRREHATLCI